MTQEQVRKVCEGYTRAVDNAGFGVLEAKCLPDTYMNAYRYSTYLKDVLAHMKYMFQVIPEMESDPGKQGRWLGWAQGVLFAFGLETINQQRDINRGLLD